MSTLLQLRDIHKSYGALKVLGGASVQLAKGDKVGFIGRNGAGKSTLCRIILGDEEPDSGQVVRSPELRLSFLEQREPFTPDESVLGFLTRYTGREEWQCGKVAARFQLANDLLSVEIGRLPGGFQTRVKLVAMLLREPNFIVLDEPTNYLDLRTLVLLENLLRDLHCGLLVVSHDREFLKRTCEKTLEVERGRLTFFPGSVEDFLAFKEEERDRELRQNKNIEAKRRHVQSFIDRYRVRASTASRAQSKLKELAKLETVEIEHPMRTATIRLPEVEARKGVALSCEDLAIGYPEKRVASGIHLEIARGERVAVLGDNGEGKTTFLRTVAGELAPTSGRYRWGHGLEAAYYAQHVYSALDPDLHVYAHLEQRAAPGTTRQEILDLAGSFLFRGEDVEKKVEVLSGGERARLALAGLLLSRKPVLLLDEPTNHLDFETVEALGRALAAHRGTIFFISHDRTFVSLVATHVVEVKAGTVTLYPGDYDAYLYRVEREAALAEQEAVPGPEKGAAPGRKAPSEDGRKDVQTRIRRLKARAAAVEKLLSEHAREREAIHRHYLENPLDYSKDRQARAAALDRLLAEEEEEWLAIAEEIEGLEGELGTRRRP